MNWEEIKREYESTNITLKALAEKHDIKLGTLKSRKSREGWSRNPTEKGTTKNKKVATPKMKVATKPKQQTKPVVESDELTDKQRLFCMYYTKYWNATKAYQKAYECNYQTANVNGSRLLVNASIKAEINRIKEERLNGIDLDAKFVLQKYIDIAFADITDFVEFGQEKRPELDHKLEPLIDENGDEVTYTYSYVNLKNHDEVDGTIVTEVKKGKDGVSVKLADKMKALEFLAKYTDLLSEFDRKRLQDEKLKAEMQFTKERTKLLQSEKKDTSLLDVLIDTVTKDD